MAVFSNPTDEDPIFAGFARFGLMRAAVPLGPLEASESEPPDGEKELDFMGSGKEFEPSEAGYGNHVGTMGCFESIGDEIAHRALVAGAAANLAACAASHSDADDIFGRACYHENITLLSEMRAWQDARQGAYINCGTAYIDML